MIVQEVVIPNSSAQQLYDVLMNSDQHSKLIGDEVEIVDKEGEVFKSFSGYADGINLELKPGRFIKQTWRASDWPEKHYSIIAFTLTDTKDGANIEFTQDNLPEGSQAEFESGWQDNYWEPLKQYFGE